MQFDTNLQIAKDQATNIFFIDGKFKRTAGRPRSGDQPPAIVIYGNSLRSPMKRESTHELLLSNPLIKVLSTLKTFLQQYNIINLTLQFRYNGLHIVESTEKRGASHGVLSMFFDARYVHYYYCSKPINVRMSRQKFMEALNVMRNETHYNLMRLRPLPTGGMGGVHSSTHMQFENIVHVSSDCLDENYSTNFEVEIVNERGVQHMPSPEGYYPLEFKIDNSAFKSFIKTPNEESVIIKKSANTNVKIYHEHSTESHINIPQSRNIVYDRVDPQQVMSIAMPIVLAATFSQQGDAANHLRIAVHPTDPIVLSYYVENTQMKTQYLLQPDMVYVAAVLRLYIMPDVGD